MAQPGAMITIRSTSEWLEALSMQCEGMFDHVAAPVISKCCIGGVGIEFHFFEGTEHRALGRAFEHLSKAIPVDGAVYKVAFAQADRQAAAILAVLEAGESIESDKEILLASDPLRKAVFFRDRRILMFVDLHKKIALHISLDMSALPYYEKAAPARFILHHILEAEGVALVHAAAVGNDQGALLLVGRGGSGKSTTALLGAVHGMSFLGDDYVAISNRHAPAVHSVFNSAKYTWETKAWLPQLQVMEESDPTQDPKGFQHLDPSSVQFEQTLPLRALVQLEITPGADTTIQPIATAEVILPLTSSTIFQMPGSGTATLKKVIEIVHHVPAYRMRLGRDQERLLKALRSLL